ncbi:MAG: hypothetical protein P8Z33_09710 [Gammaproteobacteria bacterium]|jgi:hypothetical protein
MTAEEINRWLSTLTNVGVLIGVVLLVIELDQNAELTRAEIHSIRAQASAERQMNLANSGEISRIFQKAFAAGFPAHPAALDVLTDEDRFRARLFIGGMKEAVANWHFQCQRGMLDKELCEASYEAQVKRLVPLLHGMNIGLGDMRRSFVADVRRIARAEGLPVPNEDGSW